VTNLAPETDLTARTDFEHQHDETVRTEIERFRGTINEFLAGNLDTAFLEGFFQRRENLTVSPAVLEAAQAAAAAHRRIRQPVPPAATGSAWREGNRRHLFR